VTSTLWQFLHTNLPYQPCALSMIMDCQGSTPAKTGAIMAISQNESIGTIGGGAIEFQLTKEARKLLTTDTAQKIHHRRIITEKLGMLCGGQQDIAICLLDQHDLPFIDSILYAIQQQKTTYLKLTAQSLQLTQEAQSSAYHYQDAEHWQYQYKLNPTERAFIIGGGHVSLALSQVLKFLNFHITIIDNRPNLALLKNNPYADCKHIIPHYREINAFIPEGSAHYVMIMTHSHRTDGIVLEQLLDRQFAYLGLMGSQKKIEHLYANLAKKGITPKQYPISAPIGLDINCQNPEEIAISIAAQVIAQKNNKPA